MVAREDLLQSALSLVEAQGVFYEQALESLRGAAAAVAPKPTTASSLLAAAALPTGIATLDAHLGGGLASGTITELVGGTCSGKTQICLALAAEALADGRNSNLGVVYLDLDHHFDAARLHRLLQGALGRRGAAAQPAVDELMHRLDVLQARDWEGYTKCISRLEALVSERPARLVLIDSIAAPALSFGGGIVARQQALAHQAAMLKALATRHNLAVLVTNRTAGADAEASSMLGVAWAHCVNVRLVLRAAASGEARRPSTAEPRRVGTVHVTKAHHAAEAAFDFVISGEGVVDVDLSF